MHLRLGSISLSSSARLVLVLDKDQLFIFFYMDGRVHHRCCKWCTLFCYLYAVDISTISSSVRHVTRRNRFLRKMTLSLDDAKLTEWRSIITIFGNVGRIAFKNVASRLQQVDVHHFNARRRSPLLTFSSKFQLNWFLKQKLFKTRNINIIRKCTEFFDFELPILLLHIRSTKFASRNKVRDNFFYITCLQKYRVT
jgi:hypothetical protein